MALTKDFVTLIPFTDEKGLHKKGEVLPLPYDTIYDKMDANRLVDYGIVAEHDRYGNRRKSRKD